MEYVLTAEKLDDKLGFEKSINDYMTENGWFNAASIGSANIYMRLENGDDSHAIEYDGNVSIGLDGQVSADVWNVLEDAERQEESVEESIEDFSHFEPDFSVGSSPK